MFFWKDSFKVDIEEIDSQHKKLFDLGNKVKDILDANEDIDHDSYNDLKAVFNELKEYAIYHFSFEEDIMAKIKYKDFDKHKKEHDAFIGKILELEKSDIYINQKGTTLEVLTFILDWITVHILKTDKSYKEDFKSNGY